METSQYFNIYFSPTLLRATNKLMLCAQISSNSHESLILLTEKPFVSDGLFNCMIYARLVDGCMCLNFGKVQ